MKELMSKFMGEQDVENRKTLSVDSVPLDESGLRELLVGERNPSARVHNFCIQNLHIIQILVYTELVYTHKVFVATYSYQRA